MDQWRALVNTAINLTGYIKSYEYYWLSNYQTLMKEVVP
jgi:hypothetical protein